MKKPLSRIEHDGIPVRAEISRRAGLIILGAFFWPGARVRASSFDDFFKAVRNDRPRDLEALRLRGFDLNTVDETGSPALVLALTDDALSVARYLADQPDVRIEARNTAGENALMIAALRGHLDILQRLLTRKAQVNRPGWTALHYAASHPGDNAWKLVQLLLDHFAYIDAESPNGTTPLMMAARYGRSDVVNGLLLAGADPRLKNQQGLNAVDFAMAVDRGRDAENIAAAIRALQPKGVW